MLNDAELLKLFLPELLIEYFEIVKFEEENKILHIYFEEKNTVPKEFSSLLLQSKGFVPEIMVDDFPLRGKTVKLHIRRRRWTDTKTGNIIQRDWNLIAKGTRMTQDFAEFLKKISRRSRMRVKEITLDMAGSMKLIAKRCFPKAIQVIDRFHVQKLAIEALQDIRVSHRWEAIEQENNLLLEAKQKKENLQIEIFLNGDTRKQFLARSRYLLYKTREKWTPSQKQRAKILFSEYPDLEKVYNLSDGLRKIYNQNIEKPVAMLKLAHWFKDVEESGFKSFNTLTRTIILNYDGILNYFNARSTNAAAESFNAKIKNFRLQLRGVRDKSFFLFRLSKLFA